MIAQNGQKGANYGRKKQHKEEHTDRAAGEW